MREVWINEESGRTPQRLELEKQLAGKLRSIMSWMPHSNSQEKDLQNLWESAQGSRILQQTLHQIQEVWRPDVQKARYRIRKLTPLETWRLQGFPDKAHEAVKQAGISDSQRYKMAGNAVTVNVIEALGKRLISYLQAEK
nr:DNA cytosine methyltransferase [Virgibacillus proomii]